MPIKNEHYLDVDLKLENYISLPRVTRNDDVFFIVRILDDGRPVSLDNVQTALLASLRPDKKTILTVGNKLENEITFKIESASLSEPGRVNAAVQLFYTDGRTSTLPFHYEVVPDNSIDYAPSESETSLIQLILGDAPFVIEAAQSATIGAEDAAAQTLEALDNFDTEKSVAIQELDDVKEENRTNWKQEVATVALRNSTYPNPQIGDTVRITGEARIDRFNGTEWVTTDRYNPAAVDNLTVKLAETSRKVNVSPLDFGAVGDGVTDDRKAIQDAFDYVTNLPNGGVVELNAGYTFLLNSFSLVSNRKYILLLRDKVSIIGNGKLKIADGLGHYHSILFANETITDVVYKEFIIDENTTGNPMLLAPDANGGYRCSIFIWKNESKNITMENLTINDCVGVWQITTGKIENFDFKGNKINFTSFVPVGLNYDRTSVYYGGVGGVVAENVFKGSAFANTALELHGKNTSCYGNFIESYNGGIFIINDQEIIDVLEGVNVTNNVLHNVKSGITLWCEGEKPIRGVKMNGNQINISPTKGGLVADEGIKSPAIQFYPTWNTDDIRDVEIMDNSIHFEKTSVQSNSPQIAGIAIPMFTGVSSYVLQNLKIKNNSIVNAFHSGIRVEPNKENSTMIGLEIENNTITNPGQFTSSGGVQLVGVPKFMACTVKNNKLIETRIPAISTQVVQYFNIPNDDGVNNLQLIGNEVFISDNEFTSLPNSKLSDYITTDGAYLNTKLPNISNKRIIHNAKIGSILEDTKTGRIFKQVTAPSGNRWVSESFGTSAPNRGYFQQGDTVKNIETSNGGNAGWVTIASGNIAPANWSSNTSYSIGDQVVSSGATYQCTKAGISGTTAPNGAVSSFEDGTATWAFLGWLPLFKTFGTIQA